MVAYIHDEAKSERIRDMKIFSEIVRLFMGHRRKTVFACTKLADGRLAAIDNWPGIFEECSIDLTARPEQLGPEDYIAIANLCVSQSRA
jgi:16S rRNA A1518/A1519 N6-dimethyltransferase RsmA/KsgA/DIM1 with predicted DNA glycosylase/AP lyase activity